MRRFVSLPLLCTGIRQFLEACPGSKPPQPPALASLHGDERLLKVGPSWVVRVHAQSIWSIQLLVWLPTFSALNRLHPFISAQVIRRIISQTERFNAPDVFQGLQELSVLKAKVGGCKDRHH